MTRVTAVYHVASSAADITARAEAIAVEQSVEMPVSAITDEAVLSDIVGRVAAIADRGEGRFEVRIDLAVATTGPEPGQLMNMLFGNTSLHQDVSLVDVVFPDDVMSAFGGPGQGLAGWRRRSGAQGRAMTCSALKPQGLGPLELAKIAHQMALGGLDFLKDDHGLADQVYSPFAERVAACAAAVAHANEMTGGRTGYLPSLSGHLDQLRGQIEVVRRAGLDAVLIAPMVTGLATFRQISRENPDIAFMAHPAMAGAARIEPALLLGKIFPLMGADAAIFPNHGGRFGYDTATCKAIADAALMSGPNRRACVPVPAGGMTLDRVPEMLTFYGPDVMLLIGGALLSAGDRLTEQTHLFTEEVRRFYDRPADEVAGPAVDRPSEFRRSRPDFRWEEVDLLAYKEEGSAPFKDITRQLLFLDPNLDCELRYFEMAAGGHSTLERHEHVHGVVILRGHGHCLISGEIRECGPHDLIRIDPLTWHQFRATKGEPLGFLCMVNVKRDRPQLPTEDELEALKRDPAIRAFLE